MSDDSLQRYIKLRNFEAPNMPTQRAFEIYFAKALTLLKKDEENDEDAISSDRLYKTPEADLATSATQIASEPLLAILDENLTDWLNSATPNDTLKIIVFPPCDDHSILQSWAERNKLECLESPTPESILSGEAVLPDISNGSVLVIPRLEAWMMRTYYGLSLIKQLLAAIENTERKIVVGCNIYAWEFLKKAVNAASFLPDPMTFQALDSKQLRDLFYSFHTKSDSANITLYHQKSAQDIFAEDDEDNESYFKILAATSRGIPWVAWHLWRNNLLTQKEEPESEDTDKKAADDAEDKALPAASSDQQILWVSALKEFTLPNSGNDLLLLVLQAILIHHEISVDHLLKVLPDIKPTEAIPLLKRAGIITQKEGKLRCKPEAYPAVREGLIASGFPTGVF